MTRIMTQEEIKAFKPFPNEGPIPHEVAVERAKVRMQQSGLWQDSQILGRRYPIGCVALEVTQKCNLDCTLCYLSEQSESVQDLPMEEVFRRMDAIRDHYGPGTDVQITGGDPTMRKREELVEIVRRVRALGMRPTLMTNGIKATRSLLELLVEAGLYDIAFHVDITQERKGYATEADLNKVRLQYIDRCRGLPIHVIFNTTVHKENFHEIPDLVRFFRQHTDVVAFASFQLQAETGRGVLRKRDTIISKETVAAQIEKGAGTKLSFDTFKIGHSDCNGYAPTLSVNGNLYDVLDAPEFILDFIERTSHLELDRANPANFAWTLTKFVATNPSVLKKGLGYAGSKLWRGKKDLIAARGKVRKLTFFIHNFMDAQNLECDRVNSCSFMAMTADGPISMCMHNAKRDEFILKPIEIQTAQGMKKWTPQTGFDEARA